MTCSSNPAFVRARTGSSRRVCDSFRRDDPTILLRDGYVPAKQALTSSRMCSSQSELLLQTKSYRDTRAGALLSTTRSLLVRVRTKGGKWISHLACASSSVQPARVETSRES